LPRCFRLQAAEYLRLATLLTPNRGSSELGAEAAHSAASLLALYADVRPPPQPTARTAPAWPLRLQDRQSDTLIFCGAFCHRLRMLGLAVRWRGMAWRSAGASCREAGPKRASRCPPPSPRARGALGCWSTRHSSITCTSSALLGATLRPLDRTAPCPALEATQGQIDGLFSQLPYKCHQNQVASVGD